MSEYSKEKKWYIKLPTNFFTGHEMRVLEGIPGGKDYELMYLKLVLESAAYSGYLRMSKDLPYTPEMLAGLTNTPVDTVRVGLEVLKSIGLMDMTESGSIHLPMVEEMVGSTTEGAAKKAIQRAKGQEGGQMSTACPPIVKELDSKEFKEGTSNSLRSLSVPKEELKPVKTSKKQNCLTDILVEYGFIDENELEDPQWKELLDGYSREYGFVNVKIKIKYVLGSISHMTNVGTDSNQKPIFRWKVGEEEAESIGNKYWWLRTAMANCIEKDEMNDGGNEDE